MQDDSKRYALPRARLLLGCFLLAAGATFFCMVSIRLLGLEDQSSTVGSDVVGIVFDGVFLLLVAASLSRSWRPALLFGLPPEQPVLSRYALIVFPLIAVSLASGFFFDFSLSYVWPGFVEWKLFGKASSTIESNGPLGNLLRFSCQVLIAPAFEEFLFRGLLLTRWSLKWNVRRAVFVSSAVFAILHSSPIRAFFFGYVMCALYIETRSLLIPIIIHMANNGIVWIMECVNPLVPNSDTPATLAEWQSYWWLGLLVTVIVTPWVIVFVRRHIPRADWRVPYLALQETDQEPEILIGEYPATPA